MKKVYLSVMTDLQVTNVVISMTSRNVYSSHMHLITTRNQSLISKQIDEDTLDSGDKKICV